MKTASEKTFKKPIFTYCVMPLDKKIFVCIIDRHLKANSSRFRKSSSYGALFVSQSSIILHRVSQLAATVLTQKPEDCIYCTVYQ